MDLTLHTGLRGRPLAVAGIGLVEVAERGDCYAADTAAGRPLGVPSSSDVFLQQLVIHIHISFILYSA